MTNKHASSMASLRWAKATPKDKARHVAKMNEARLEKLRLKREGK